MINRTNWKKRYLILAKACDGVPETLLQSADIIDDDIDGECTAVREMAKKLEQALSFDEQA